MAAAMAPPAESPVTNTRAVDTVFRNDLCDHPANGKDLAVIPAYVLWVKPIEAEVWIVCPSLLGKQQREAIVLGQSRPPGPNIISGGGLGAAVQDNHKGHVFPALRRQIDVAPQSARV
ncbi:hypothetical protein FHS25_004146 [Rhizobium laguerreae]|uniref:Uncharacterized protein n=1 Tax=Rhizobium laguerreae TaxID=1076926 RepID=A0ABR6GCR9_9HYPH|nr:hypothetical protein [Rhizobium laguerreae]